MAQQYKTGLIITGDASGGIRAIKATDDELGKLNQGFQRGSQRSKQFNANVNATGQGLAAFKRIAAPIAGLVAGMFAANTLQGQINWGDQLQKTNLRIGASTEALSQYNYVASLSGVEFNQLTTAWQRQTRRIAEAAQGTGVASKALESLGLNARELNQLAPEEQFERIAEAMQGVESSSERVRLAQKLWDSEGVKLVQIVNSGTDAIAQMRAEADALGLTISQDTANAMATYNDEVDRLKFAAQGLTQTMLAELVPSLTQGLQTANGWVRELGGAEVIVGNVTDAAAVLAALLAGRYAGAFATATAAKLGATRQAILYQSALARMAGVSKTAAAGQLALAGATRAAAGAMALVGGPLGAAMLAGGAIYYFREELGLTVPVLNANSQAVSQLTGSLNMLTRAEAQVTLTRLVGQLAEARVAAEEASEAILDAGRPESGTSSGSGVLGMSGSALTQQTRSIREASTEARAARQNITDLEEAISLVNGRLADLDRQGEETTPTITEIGTATTEAAKATTTLSAAYEALLDRLQPNRRAARQYASDVNVLNLALVTGRMTAVQYMQAMGQLNKQFQEAQRTGEEVGAAYGISLPQSTTELSRAAQDVGFAFESSFENALLKGEKVRTLLGGIAEDMARIMLRQSVTAPLGNWAAGAIGGLFAGPAPIEGGFLGQIGGYANGGYTGAGARLEPAGIVHRGEFVVQKSVVERPGVRPMLEALNQGVAHQYANGGHVIAPAAPPRRLGPPGYADGGYVAPGPAPINRINHTQYAHTQQGNVTLTVSVPVTVQAAPGVDPAVAQEQGRAIGQSVEGAVVRVLQKEMRPGGILYRG